MALSLGTRVVVQRGRSEGTRGVVLDIDRDAGCCKVAFDENPSVPAKVAIRHLSPDLDSYRSTLWYSQDKLLDVRSDEALAEAIEACAQATSSFCSSTVREALARTAAPQFEKEQISQLSEQLSRRMTRLEQRMEAMDEAFRSREEVPHLREREKEELWSEQKRVMQDLRLQLEQRLGHLTGQVEDVTRLQSQLQADVQSLASKVPRQPEADYESALRKLTSNMEDIRSLMASPVQTSPRRSSQASSPPPGHMSTIATSPRTWSEPLPSVTCRTCQSTFPPDANFCRKCGCSRRSALGPVPPGERGERERSPSSQAIRLGSSPRGFSWQLR
ncbi:unnamed protein product [Durusdinium trenchii]|uniref:FYVE zinc finger domain-containing protein n=1 Tax=Durusdinium trenchii TaxID=1381693 RepID=A0ABP0K3Z5_9DINO